MIISHYPHFNLQGIPELREHTIPSFRFWFTVSLTVSATLFYTKPSYPSYTGLLNISLLACGAIPPDILGAFDRLVATPFTLNRSEKVAACVSVRAGGSRALGGAMDSISIRLPCTEFLRILLLVYDRAWKMLKYRCKTCNVCSRRRSVF